VLSASARAETAVREFRGELSTIYDELEAKLAPVLSAEQAKRFADRRRDIQRRGR